MKVTYVDNSAVQYDGSASEVVGVDKQLGLKGRLYIGDRDSASFVQIKHRGITAVVNCEKDIHGVSKEDVVYLNIDPEDDQWLGRKSFELALAFLDKELSEKSSRVLIHCQTGNGRSCGILIYYLMRKLNVSLASAHRQVLKLRGGLQLRSSLAKMLMEEERSLRPGKNQSVALNEKRQIIYTDGGGGDALFGSVGGDSAADNKLPKRKGGGGGAWMGAVAVIVFLAITYFALDKLIEAGKPAPVKPRAKASGSGGGGGGGRRGRSKR